MKKLEISVTKAQLTAFNVSFEADGGKPRVEATIALLTDENKHITDFQISTYSWNEEKKFELPLEMIVPLQRIATALEHVIIEHVRDGQLSLGEALPVPF